MNGEALSASWIEDARSEEYSATMTGNPFLFRESRLLADLLAKGMSTEDARSHIAEGNLFQYRSTKSVPKRVNALARRLGDIPEDVLRFLSQAPLTEARLVNLLMIAVKDRLYREFLLEEIVPAYDAGVTLSPLHIERFLEAKAALSPKVASWKQAARTKLRTVWTSSLTEAGLLDRGLTVHRPVPSPETVDLVRTFFTKPYQVIAGVGS